MTSISSFTPQQLSDYWGAGKTPEQVASDMQNMGVTGSANDISAAVKTASGGTYAPTSSDVTQWIGNNNQYSGLITAQATPPGIQLDPTQGGAQAEPPKATGLIAATTPTPTPLGEAPQTQTETVAYNPSTMNSWDRLGSMLSSGNPTMQAAQTAGLQYANTRGLINSSIGESAVLNSMTNAAQPYALQDASSNLQNAQFNAGQSNSVGVSNTGVLADFQKTASALGLEYDKLSQQDKQFISQLSQQDRQFVSTLNLENAKFTEDKAQFAAKLAEGARQFNASQVLQKYGIDTNAATSTTNAGIAASASAASDASRYNLGKMEAELQAQSNRDSHAAAIYQQGIANITNIAGSSLDPAAKQTAYDNQLQMMGIGLTLFGKDSSVIPQTFKVPIGGIVSQPSPNAVNQSYQS